MMKGTVSGGYSTESVTAPAAAVAECPDGKEVEEGVFMSGSTAGSWINGRARLKKNFAPSATVHDPATAAQGRNRLQNENQEDAQTSRNPKNAKAPQTAPAEPITVATFRTRLSGVHFRPKTARNRARSARIVCLASSLRVRFPFRYALGTDSFGL